MVSTGNQKIVSGINGTLLMDILLVVIGHNLLFAGDFNGWNLRITYVSYIYILLPKLPWKVDILNSRYLSNTTIYLNTL